jgi:hypothetical protein
MKQDWPMDEVRSTDDELNSQILSISIRVLYHHRHQLQGLGLERNFGRPRNIYSVAQKLVNCSVKCTLKYVQNFFITN